ncbi:MAG: 4Fe-4S dicluster domain-containing protein, partial [Deltaproteobacteria bacterium]|nr:4Fe-4S dicluster domain-containing protein [Deltaproteobacteria bacterium]
VETKEGRVIKVEGNPLDPISKGGTCALGQSSVQGLYDPNRVREPLERVETTDEIGNPIVTFKPIGFNDALSKIATALKNSKNRLFLCSELDDLHQKIYDQFCKDLGFIEAQYEPFNHSDLQKASLDIFGVNRAPTYDLTQAQVIVSFGAEFLEYWLNPVKFTKQWAYMRKNKLCYHFQIEPRQTLTGSKADKWIKIKPNTEHLVALALLKFIVKLKDERTLPDNVLSELNSIDEDELISESGIERGVVTDLAATLLSSKSSVVLGGGLQAKFLPKVLLERTCLLINYCLGNIGKSVILGGGPAFRSNYGKVQDVLLRVKNLKGEGAVLLVKGNYAHFLPASNSISELNKLVKPGLVVVFADVLDKTCEIADIILPLNHFLESFSFSLKENIVSLNQPAMLNLFKTRPFGDYLLALISVLSPSSVLAKYKTSDEFWKDEVKGYLKTGSLSDALERGYVIFPNKVQRPLLQNFKLELKNTIRVVNLNDNKKLTLLPIGSIKSWDGRCQNRSWLLELHDPVSLVCWDTWIELSPRTAKKLKLKNKDIVLVSTKFGEIEAQVVVNTLIQDGVLGVPVGISDGSKSLSFAKLVKKANGFLLFDYENTGEFKNTSFKIKKVVSYKKAYQSQVTRSEHGRRIVDVKELSPTLEQLKPFDYHEHHHEKVDLYKQREHPIFKWGMAVDLSVCTGCSACVVACYAENNIPVVGPRISAQGRRMPWISIHTYDKPLSDGSVRRVWLPLMCQQCNNAPCEPVCPVYATYHNEEGLNAMIYNRCVGTRYCANNCVYKVRRFNWFEYDFPDTLKLQLNPDVTKRGVGVMEKCNFCIQRINEGKFRAKKEGRLPRDGEIQTACQQACPADAIVFGNLNDPGSKVSEVSRSERAWKLIDEYVNTKPSVTYLADYVFKI